MSDCYPTITFIQSSDRRAKPQHHHCGSHCHAHHCGSAQVSYRGFLRVNRRPDQAESTAQIL
jgi:hypothetical protein